RPGFRCDLSAGPDRLPKTSLIPPPPPPPPTPLSASNRTLFVHADPARVAERCGAQSRPGSLLVAPSAAARRQAVRAFLERERVAIGVSAIARSRLLPTLELRAGMAPGAQLPPELERMLAREAGAAAGVPLFDGHGSTARAPAGAGRALVMLRQRLRMNDCTADNCARGGGDARAAEAGRHMGRRRVALKLEDEADRIRRLIDSGVPSLDVVFDEPH